MIFYDQINLWCPPDFNSFMIFHTILMDDTLNSHRLDFIKVWTSLKLEDVNCIIFSIFTVILNNILVVKLSHHFNLIGNSWYCYHYLYQRTIFAQIFPYKIVMVFLHHVLEVMLACALSLVGKSVTTPNYISGGHPHHQGFCAHACSFCSLQMSTFCLDSVSQYWGLKFGF